MLSKIYFLGNWKSCLEFPNGTQLFMTRPQLIMNVLLAYFATVEHSWRVSASMHDFFMSISCFVTFYQVLIIVWYCTFTCNLYMGDISFIPKNLTLFCYFLSGVDYSLVLYIYVQSLHG